MKLSLIVIFQFLFLNFSWADIVFIDFNNGPKEIAAARKAAKKRGEKVIVFPSVSKKIRQKLIGNSQRQERLYRDLSRIQDQQKRERIEQNIRDLERERKGLKRETTNVNANTMAQFFQELADRGTDVSSLVLSGHDGNGSFSGAFGAATAMDLKEILKRHPQLAGKIKSMFMAGCYTTKPGTLDFDWKKVLPNLHMVAGYNDTAPLNHRPAGHKYIYNALSGEKKLLSLKKPKSIQSRIRSIIPRHLGNKASICLPDGKYGTRSQFTDMKKAWAACPENIKKAKEMRKDYECFLAAETEECATPPKNAHVNNPLRDFYNLIQKLEPCQYNKELRGQLIDANLPSGQKIIRLIYYKNIRKHFKKKFAKELQDSKGILKKAGLGEKYLKQLENIDKLKRSEARELIAAIEKIWYDRKDQIGQDKAQRDRDVSAVAASFIGGTMKAYLLNLGEHCVPFSWVESTSDDSPACGGDMGDKSLALAKSQFDRIVLVNKRRKAQGEKDKAQKALHKIGEAVVGKDPISQESEKVISATLKMLEALNEVKAVQKEENIFYYQEQIEKIKGFLKKHGNSLSQSVRDRKKRTIARYERRIKTGKSKIRRLRKKVKVPDEELKKKNPRKYYQVLIQEIDKKIKEEDLTYRIFSSEDYAKRIKERLQKKKGKNKMQDLTLLLFEEASVDDLKERKQDLADQKKYYQLMGDLYGEKSSQAKKEIVQLIKKRSKEQYRRKLKSFERRINILRARQRQICRLDDQECNRSQTEKIKKLQEQRKKFTEFNEAY